MTTLILLHLIKPDHTGHSIMWTIEDLNVFNPQFKSNFFCEFNSYFEILNGCTGLQTGKKYTIREWKMR